MQKPLTSCSINSGDKYNKMLLQKVRVKGHCRVLYNLPINKKCLSINVLVSLLQDLIYISDHERLF